MVKIGDDELQAAEGLFLPGPVNTYILQTPEHKATFPLPAQRRHADFQPLRHIGAGARRR
jgi:hypothetical protein